MLLSFPLPFFTCRELVIVWLLMCDSGRPDAERLPSRQNNSNSNGAHPAFGRPQSPTDYGLEDELHRRLLSHDGEANSSLVEHRGPPPVTPYFPQSFEDKRPSSASASFVSSPPSSFHSKTHSAEGGLSKALRNKTLSVDRLLLLSDDEDGPEGLAGPSSSSFSPSSPPSSLGFQLRSPYHQILTLVIFALSVSIAALSPSLGSVLDLVGNVCGSAIAFILPAAIFIKLENRLTVLSGLMICVGCFIGLIGTTFSIKNIVDGNEDGNCCS